ncbi:MAG TPA: ZIP family metal transporter [Candidatus Thermoplasmatota archaeon]|nr:ZIP family metal transporter [Candidatus Thermoplasmatota archaeon]
MDPIVTAVLLGLYVGVIPVYLGLFPAPLMRRLGDKWLDGLVALSVGVLLFLLIDVAAEGMEMGNKLNAAMQVPAAGDASVPPIDEALFGLVGPALAPWLGPALVFVGLSAGILSLVWVANRRGAAVAASEDPAARRLRLAALVALGIGLHNLGEGLAVGAAVAGGNMALAGLLVVGFALHNVTEGVAILAPASRDRLSLGRLAWLGGLAGVPTILGALLGILFFSNALGVLFFAIAAGAVLYVIVEVLLALGRDFSNSYVGYGGLIAGFAIMLLTAQFLLL